MFSLRKLVFEVSHQFSLNSLKRDLPLRNGFLKKARQCFIQMFSTSLPSLILIHFILDYDISYGRIWYSIVILVINISKILNESVKDVFVCQVPLSSILFFFIIILIQLVIELWRWPLSLNYFPQLWKAALKDKIDLWTGPKIHPFPHTY